MNSATKSKLETIKAYPFFQSVGKPPPASVAPVGSWQLAAKSAASIGWQNCQLMARNALNWSVQLKDWNRGQEWNPLIDELQPLMDAFVDSVLCKIPCGESTLTKVKKSFSRDLKFICLEAHYSDIVNPPFFIPLLEPWYAVGHFPCGWDGDEFPDGWDGIIRSGQLMVF